MKRYIKILILILLGSCNSNPSSKQDGVVNEEDSIGIASPSLTFYTWYIDCLDNDSTYNIVQPIYIWKDSVPVLKTEKYFRELTKLGIASQNFINSEKQRFKKCQDSLNHINFKAVEDCQCSVGEFYKECEFIDYYYWIASQEKFDGCFVEKIAIINGEGICRIKFYYLDGNQKVIEKRFTAIVHLLKEHGEWLIYKIEKENNAA